MWKFSDVKIWYCGYWGVVNRFVPISDLFIFGEEYILLFLEKRVPQGVAFLYVPFPNCDIDDHTRQETPDSCD